jgi:hypothetical protein
MCCMSREGKYAAWFRTPRGEGTGVVHIAEGKIRGGDSTFDYAAPTKSMKINLPQRW